MNWENILQNLGIFGLFAGLLTWLIKSAIQNYINRSFKSYEKELEIKSEDYRLKLDKNLEEYKRDLQLYRQKQERLHVRRSQVLEEIYKRIVILDFAMQEMTNLFKQVMKDYEEEEKKRIEKAGNAYNNFLQYYKEHKIFFTNHTCEILDNLVKKFFDSLWDYSYYKGSTDLDLEKKKEAYQNIKSEIPKVKEEIEKEFRTYIGVE